MKKKLIFLLIIILLISLIVIILFQKKDTKSILNNDIKHIDNDFNLNLIRNVNQNNQNNYLISPYSIEIALNLLKEGADGNTLSEIDGVIGNRNINDISIKNRVSIANAAFIKREYQKYIKSSYYRILKDKYRSDILYDDFISPKVINDWVDNKTDGMIKKVLDEIDDDFILGLANALAIDLEWSSPFQCNATNSQKFTKVNNEVIDIEMMHKTLDSDGNKYLEADDAVGVIIPYKKYDENTGKESFSTGRSLEFVAILPNDNLYNYIDNLTSDKLNKLLDSSKEASNNFKIKLSLPRFKYDYDLNNFKEVLMNLGISEVFDKEKANLSKIMTLSDNNIYVEKAIHKTHIDLNEKGTRAAAVTFFGIYKNSIMNEEFDEVIITFDRPFMYIIRDSESKEMLFFGTVYEPNIWFGSTCSES